MRLSRLILAMVGLVWCADVCHADITQIHNFYQSVLSATDDSWIQRGDQISGLLTVDVILSSPAEQIESLLPLGQQCLRSQRAAIQGLGLYLFVAVSSRP